MSAHGCQREAETYETYWKKCSKRSKLKRIQLTGILRNLEFPHNFVVILNQLFEAVVQILLLLLLWKRKSSKTPKNNLLAQKYRLCSTNFLFHSTIWKLLQNRKSSNLPREPSSFDAWRPGVRLALETSDIFPVSSSPPEYEGRRNARQSQTH